MIEKIKDRKKILIVLTALLLLVIATSFAYFLGGVGPAANTDVDITSGTTEKLTFIPGTALDLTINETTLAEGGSSLSSSTTSSAKLVAGSKTGTADETYQVYFNIADNTFTYSVDTNTPEMIMKVTDPTGTELTSIDGLTYKTIVDASGTSISGFDVTVATDLIKIREDYPISTTSSTDGTVHDWEVEILFVNLTTNQSANENKVFDSVLILQKEKMTSGDLFYEKILLDNGGKTYIDSLTYPAFDASGDGIFATSDYSGTTYIFRGTVDNNYVYFNGMYWKIIRIDGENKVRLLYYATEGDGVNTGTDNNLGEASYDTSGTRGPIFLENSTIYQNELKNFYDSLVSATSSSYFTDAIYCKEDEYITEASGSDNIYIFNHLARFQAGLEPSLMCSEGVNNRYYSLLSLDEVRYTGIEESNYSYYLNFNYFSWLSSHANDDTEFNYSEIAYILNGNLSDEYGFNSMQYGHSFNYNPIVNINTNVTTTGTGTWEDPYLLIN